eukprot:2682735-Amphidinium_carterae.2
MTGERRYRSRQDPIFGHTRANMYGLLGGTLFHVGIADGMRWTLKDLRCAHCFRPASPCNGKHVRCPKPHESGQRGWLWKRCVTRDYRVS